MSIINYAVEVKTDKAVTANDTYGFDGTTFRWITGRPTYDGSTVVPKWEDGSDNTHKWAEGWILQDEIGEPTRSVDISSTGGYGTLSGFEFSIRNSPPTVGADPLWKWIRDNRIYFTNREVNLYIVIDDVFYAIWSGVVENNPIEEIGYKFKCIDASNKLHRTMPPLTVNRNILPQSDDESQGKPISICVGDISYSKILTVTNAPSEQVLVISKPLVTGETEGKAAAAVEYDTHTALNPRLRLYTKDKSFVANALVNKFMYVTRGGGFSDVDILNKIISNEATDADGFTWISLESPFEYVTEEVFNEKYTYDPYYIKDLLLYSPESASNYDWVSVSIKEPEESKFYSFGYSNAPLTDPVNLAKYNFLRYDNVDMYNSGVGCNRVNMLISMAAGGSCYITIRLGAIDGEIIGQKFIQNPVDSNNIKHYEHIPIKKQDSTVTLYISVAGDAIWYNTYDDASHNLIKHLYQNPRFLEVYGFTVGGADSGEDTWWFSIVEMGGTHLISSNPITKIVTDNGTDTGKPLLYIYDKNRKVMDPVPNQIYDVVLDNSGVSGHPEFILYSSNIRKDGEVQYLATITPSRWSIEIEPNLRHVTNRISWEVIQSGHINIGGTVQAPYVNHLVKKIFPTVDICNRNQNNYVTIMMPDYEDYKNSYAFTVKLEYPKEYLAYEVEEIYICIDADYTAAPVAPSTTAVPIRIIMFIDVLDVYGNVVNSVQYDDIDNDNKGDLVWPTDQIPVASPISLNTLPDAYYDNGGVKETGYVNQWKYVGKDSADEDVTLRSMLKLKSELWNMIKDGSSSNIIQARVIITSNGDSYKGGAPFSLSVKLKEAGIMGIRSTNALNDDYYCRLKGEKTPDGSETNNVYNAFRLMLETYDGIPASKIDYTNLPVTRADWTVGRQISEAKSSKDYIKELAQHSFTAVYPMRNGKRGLKAWLEDTDIVKAFDSDDIIRDSIKGWQRTDVEDLYNEFRLEYNWNTASNTYIDSISLMNTDKYYPIVGGVTGAVAGFPSPTMMCDYPADKELWRRDYVGGISPNSWEDANYMWTRAHESYDVAGAVQELPKSLSQLPWYTNTYQFNNAEFRGASKGDSPFNYLMNLCEWSTLQKYEVKFNVPLTLENVSLELLDYISFSDTIYTNNEVKYGWITGIEFNPSKNYMRITATLSPDKIIDRRVIRERGQLLNFNKYTESGSETGVLVDGQGRI